MKIKFKWQYALLSISLVFGAFFSCSAAKPTGDVVTKYKNVLILGNSITRHGPKRDIGWSGDWGMAASARDSDYVHLLIKKFQAIEPGAIVRFRNINDFEKGYWKYNLSQLDDLKQSKPDLIILRLGENVEVGTMKANDFKKYYAGLISYLTADNPKAKILNASSFWKKEAVANEIRAVSEARGDQFVDLSVLSTDSTNMAFGKFQHKGVAMHPSDKGMKAIAKKIWGALFKQNQSSSIMLGAYYFDGWAGLTPHLTPELANDFPERKPIWGWVTSKQDVIEDQIDLAANSGLSFFSFCWYFTTIEEFKDNPRNRALSFFLNAKNKEKLKFNLLVANHGNYIIGPHNWNYLCKYWINLFKNPQYVKVEGSPLLTFFSAPSLIKSFGSGEKVSAALKELRAMAKENGLPGVTVAICHNPDAKAFQMVAECGFDIATGYNYHEFGYEKDKFSVPIEKLESGSVWVWNALRKSPLPIIPTITTNWDPRPWPIQYKNSPGYTGYSEKSVESSIKAVRKFMDDNPDEITKERFALVYAWNEYGEGAWLTPSKPLKKSLLTGVKNGLK
ncbi:glycoside hydrolase family 99-like domain-containing protein [Pedobacter nyackensis]|uniref:Lysophospholipase L1 n=1 Tax=Pedobacter nyackensis TaxID=475255 RepID=A0A1W2EPM4_9SPHI|nr:glycoside hydrolase family 99-like domain-containing protein [Pedobacter nyackensis]SMD11615.1 Lysophospholipase L1 [Pedobacter nyackensis]